MPPHRRGFADASLGRDGHDPILRRSLSRSVLASRRHFDTIVK